MSIEAVLASCVILQFVLLLILFGWKQGVEHRLDIMYRFMRESDESAYWKVARTHEEDSHGVK